jgi:hypothetical protein
MVMSHKVSYNSDLRIIEVKFQGTVTLHEVEEAFPEAVRLAREQNCFLSLSDLRDAAITLSTVELYDLPQKLSALFASSGISDHEIKRALVAEKDLDDYRFFETVTVNRGQRNKIFRDTDEARRWLLEK